MLLKRKLMQPTSLVIATAIILTCSYAIQKVEGITFNYDIPAYSTSMPDAIQPGIEQLCETNNFSYDLVLAIFHVEDKKNVQNDEITKDVKNLIYIRDYWAGQGYSDEDVFALMLLSREKGLQYYIAYMEKNDTYTTDDYVQNVAQYKYYLEKKSN